MPFSPTDLTNLLAWYKADGALWQDSARTIPVALDGDPVGAWDDESGNGNHLLQATTGHQPMYRTEVLNGRPIVRFDGVDDHLQDVSIPIVVPQHIYALVDTTNMGNDYRVFLQRGPAPTAQDPSMYFGAGAGKSWRPTVYWNGDRAVWGVAIRRAAIIRWRISAVDAGVRVDDGIEVTGAHAESTTLNWVQIAFEIVQQAAFDALEIIIAGAVPAQEDADLMNYLTTRGYGGVFEQPVGGLLSFAGSIGRETHKNFVGSLSFAGTVTTIKARILTLLTRSRSLIVESRVYTLSVRARDRLLSLLGRD